jgi:type IV pilus assembly protein PilB
MVHNFLNPSQEDLARALKDQTLNFQEEEVQKKAKTLQLPYMDLHAFPMDLNVLGLFTEEEATSSSSVPFYRDGRDLRIGTHAPENALLKSKIKELEKKFKITLYYVSEQSLGSAFKLYKKITHPAEKLSETVKVDPDVDYMVRIKKLVPKPETPYPPATEVIADLMGAALAIDASDIHLEPEEHILKVRYRIDGVLQDMVHIDPKEQSEILSRIKMISKLKLNVTNVPQDGRFTFYSLRAGDAKENVRAVDVRVSFLPSAYGEAVVMRLLGTSATNLKLNELGLRGKAYKIIEHELNKPNGMIITTGPTGSGKTTTLYAFLNELNQPGVKIITLEDPVEYKLEGIQQTPIDHRVDFNFAKGLRAILRQDPDIVMVGEIRDGETADTALQAALTGHIVLSTLHTNDASGAIPRLLVMGIKPFIIAPAMNAIIAQRLVRKLCQVCKKPVELTAENMGYAKKILSTVPAASEIKVPEKLQFYSSPGCNACHDLGYQGRIGIYEVMEVDDTVKEMINKQASAVELKQNAIKDGMVTMVQDGLLKALEGITGVEEVFRVAGDW